MKKVKISKRVLIVLLISSLLFNFLVIGIDTIPFLWSKAEGKYFEGYESIELAENPEEIIITKSLEMADSDKVKMVWDEQRSFTEELLKLKNINENNLFKKYNYPRAFLISGLTDYAKATNDSILMFKTAEIFDRYLDSEGNPDFDLNKVDQVPFGVAAINLYQFTNNLKYKKFADSIYFKILSLVDKKHDVVLYREDQKIQLNDVLGMICPFLIRYQEINNESESFELAYKQLNYYKKFGVDQDTYLPTHGINLNSKIKIGPTNWGRGIGWYIIALAEYDYKRNEKSEELEGLIKTLFKMRSDDLFWSQFPGLTQKFDASSTTMFMYAINLTQPGTYSKNDILNILGSYISKDGVIKSTSGDTYGINHYSLAFGDSELSQGMLLMLLSTTYNQ